jgi:zinc transport system substrate-binding protein
MARHRTWSLAWLTLVGAALAVGLTGCFSSPDPWEKEKGPPRVVVTIPPLDCFVQNVVRDHAGVVCLCKDKGPHHFEADTADVKLFRQANVFFAIGLQLDDRFADRLQRESRNPNLQYVKLGDRLPHDLLLKADHDDDHDHAHAGEGKAEATHAGHEHGEYDPHVWLGIPQAIKMVEMIRDEMKKVDAAHAEDYDKNADEYVKTLQKLQEDSKAKLADRKNKNIVSFHESLAYFANSFGLKVVESIEKGPGDEPTSGWLKKVADECEEHEVHVIAVEPQYPTTSSAKILQQSLKKRDEKRKKEGKEPLDVQLVEVDPLETVDVMAGDLRDSLMGLKDRAWYVNKMRKNIDNLARALR